MRRNHSHLFWEGDLVPTLENVRSKLLSEIDNLSRKQLLCTDDATISEHLVATYKFTPITLAKEALEMIEPNELTTREPSEHFPGRYYERKRLQFRFELPFSRDAILFKCKPSSFDLNPPQGEIVGNHVVFTILGESNDGPRIKQTVDAWVASVAKYAEWQRPQVEVWNTSLPVHVKNRVVARRKKLEADKELVAGFGIPVRRRGDPPRTYTFPIKPKSLIPSLPAPKPGALARPEPALDAAVYEDILDTLAGMSVVMERSPSAFASLDEESLRMQFLIPLNAKYQGQATGETFNASGKTDILIKHNDRILFVAECKFWKGAQSLSEAIDQLLGYLTWRETKAAILLFNRNRDFSAVLAQVPNVIQGHPQFVRTESYNKSTGFRFVVRHPNDHARHLHVTILVFDVPQPASDPPSE